MKHLACSKKRGGKVCKLGMNFFKEEGKGEREGRVVGRGKNLVRW